MRGIEKEMCLPTGKIVPIVHRQPDAFYKELGTTRESFYYYWAGVFLLCFIAPFYRLFSLRPSKIVPIVHRQPYAFYKELGTARECSMSFFHNRNKIKERRVFLLLSLK